MAMETILDHAQAWETKAPDRLWLTQPMGADAIKTYTWAQALDEARRMAAHLKSLGLPEKSHIALLSKNTAWWVLADLAIAMAGHVSVPIFPTLTPDVVRYVIDHSGVRLIFIGKIDGYADLAPGIPEALPRIELPLGPGTAAPKWADLVAKTKPLAGVIKRNPAELWTVVYTSGSTAQPKGVMLSFAAQERSARAIVDVLALNADDRAISYLPLAHVMERWVVESAGMVAGSKLWFAESLETFVADLRRAKPTLFISVPRLWAKFQAGVFKKLPPAKLDRLLKIPILRGIIRKKVLTGLGLEHVRFAGSGSAPIPAEIIAWYRRLGLELLEAYGMSENFCVSHLNRPGRALPGFVGETYAGVECRISEEGEIQVKSPGMMMGYYKDAAATAEAFTGDGWLRTGDKGQLDPEGRLKITGRLKELFKTSKGKYVAPSPIEIELQLHADVESCCVMGSGMPQPWAVVMLSEDGRKKLKDAEATAALQQSLVEHLGVVNKGLPGHEQLDFLVVVREEWTIADGALTPTMKIKRRVLEERYMSRAEGWGAGKKPVVLA